jgi:hypothetical protein
LKKNNSPGTDQILAELIQAGIENLHSAICKIINSIWNKEELLQQLNQSIIVSIYEKTKKTKLRGL